MDNISNFLAILGALLGVVGVLLAVFCLPLSSLVTQKLTDWGKLSAKYPLHSAFDGEWLDWQTIIVGKFLGGLGMQPHWTSIGFTRDYLYIKIRPKFIFPFIKAIQVPWAAISSISETSFFGSNYCTFVIDGAPKLMIRPGEAFNNYLVRNAGCSKLLQDFISKHADFLNNLP